MPGYCMIFFYCVCSLIKIISVDLPQPVTIEIEKFVSIQNGTAHLVNQRRPLSPGFEGSSEMCTRLPFADRCRGRSSPRSFRPINGETLAMDDPQNEQDQPFNGATPSHGTMPQGSLPVHENRIQFIS